MLVLGGKNLQHINKANTSFSERFDSVSRYLAYLLNYRKVKSFIWHPLNALPHNRNTEISLS